MEQKIEDLHGHIFKVKGNRDLFKKVPIAFNENFIFNTDRITGDYFILVEMPDNKWDAIFRLGKAWDYLYLRVSLELVDTKPSNDIRKAYLYGKKKNTKTFRDNQYDGRIPSTKRSRNTKKG